MSNKDEMNTRAADLHQPGGPDEGPRVTAAMLLEQLRFIPDLTIDPCCERHVLDVLKTAIVDANADGLQSRLTDSERDEVADIEARLNAATPGPWTHFYPEHREAKSGVIRPPSLTMQVGDVTIDSDPVGGLRYQLHGKGPVNGQDRHSIAVITPPRSRSTSDWDGVGKEASALAFAHVKADGEFIANASTDIRRLLQLVRKGR